MTPLSCHRFRANEVRLWLSVIAYNLREPVAAARAAEADQHLVADESAASADEDGWPARETRAVPLATAGGRGT